MRRRQKPDPTFVKTEEFKRLEAEFAFLDEDLNTASNF